MPPSHVLHPTARLARLLHNHRPERSIVLATTLAHDLNPLHRSSHCGCHTGSLILGIHASQQNDQMLATQGGCGRTLTLQGIPAETEWLGPDAPDWSYLWLAHMPFVPALDLDRCEGERRQITRGGKQIEVLETFTSALLRLRNGFVPPCGLFTPAESTPLLIMASEAVAAAILHAGCTGIEFRHPEAAFILGRWFRRSVDGVELHPRNVAMFEDQDDSAPYTLPDMGLPPIGPPLRWAYSALDLIDWEAADKELEAWPANIDGAGAGWDTGHVRRLLDVFELNGDDGQPHTTAEYLEMARIPKCLAAIAAVRAGRAESVTFDWCDEFLVAIRPDAVWIWSKHALPSTQLRSFPLDHFEAVVRRWAEAIRRFIETKEM